MAHDVSAPQQIYDRLWNEGTKALEQNQPELDPFLNDRSGDSRRCVTLALRPDREVRTSVTHFLREAANVSPGQHFYRPDELHVTVLAVIPSTTFWREQLHELPAIRAVVSDVLRERSAFSISFRGVTVSQNAVMIQGFPADDSLSRLRDDLRAALKRNKLCPNLDRRYRISTAHVTVMRFKTACADWRRFLELLKANRTTHFGETRVKNLELIFGDFYASTESVRTLEKYELAEKRSRTRQFLP